jgi:hypothetical protein
VTVDDINVMIVVGAERSTTLTLKGLKGPFGTIVATVAQCASFGLGEGVGDGLLTFYATLLAVVVDAADDRYLTWVKLSTAIPKVTDSTTREALGSGERGGAHAGFYME